MKRLPLLCAAALLCAAGGWWLFAPESGASGVAANATGTLASLSGSASNAARLQNPGSIPGVKTMTTHGAGNDAFLNADLRPTFEAMLFEASGGGEMPDPAALKKRLAELVPRYFPPEFAARATALLERYVDYRVALGEIKAPADPGDPRALRAALDARQRTRNKFFASEEYDALFSEEARLDSYTLARIEIEKNTALTGAQKQSALKEAETGLSDAQRAERSASVAQVGVAAQTAALEASNASDAERYAQRQAIYGDAAALQLAGLDRENRDWQARLTEYASAQAQKSPPEQLAQLRGRLFSAQEQMRVEAALALRALPSPAQP